MWWGGCVGGMAVGNNDVNPCKQGALCKLLLLGFLVAFSLQASTLSPRYRHRIRSTAARGVHRDFNTTSV